MQFFVLIFWRRSRQAHERVSPERDAPATKSSGCPRPKAEPSGAQAAARAALAGASGVCKRTQTAGEIALDVTDFGEGLVWLFVLDLKGRCSVSLSDGSGELSGRSHFAKCGKIFL